MAKQINWEQFTKLTPEERAQMKEFIDNYGAEIEKAQGIEINEEYISNQIDQNLSRYHSACEYKKRMDHCKELMKQFPIPEGVDKTPGMSRGYMYYLTDNADDNIALQESMKTQEGRQAFFNRMAKDLLTADFAGNSHLDDQDKAIEFANNNFIPATLAYITPNIAADLTSDYALDEPLLTTIEDKAKLIEFSSDPSHIAEYNASPLGLLLPPQTEESILKLYGCTNMMKKYANEVLTQTGYLGPEKKEAERYRQMAKDGYFYNNVRLKDADGNYINKGKAMRDNIPCTIEILPDATQASIKNQLENMPMFTSPSEIRKELEALGMDVDATEALAVKTDGKEHFIFGKDEVNPRRVHFDRNTQKFVIGDLVEREPVAPSRPGWWQRFAHSLNSNWYRTEMDTYTRENTKYTSEMQKYDKVRAQIEERKAANAEKQRQFREANNAGIEKDLKARADFLQSAKTLNINNITEENVYERQKNKELMDKARIDFTYKVGSEDKGYLQRFGHEAVIQVAGLASFAEKDKEIDNWKEETVRQCMAYKCVYDLVKLEHTMLGDKAPGPQERELMQQMKAVENGQAEKPIQMVKDVMDNPVLKNKTKNITTKGIVDFITKDGGTKLNIEMAKELQKQKDKTVEPQMEMKESGPSIG